MGRGRNWGLDVEGCNAVDWAQDFCVNHCDGVHRATSGELFCVAASLKNRYLNSTIRPLAYLLRIQPQTGGELLNGKLGETYSEARLRWT